MTSSKLPEFWLRGPIAGVPLLLQPVAHALLQSGEEIKEFMDGFPEELLWKRPSGMASAGFHLQHLEGVADRLFTYARGQALNEEQLAALAAEKQPNSSFSVDHLVQLFIQRADRCIAQLKATDEHTLTDFRGVGRNQLPSTVIGLFFHTAEHVQRHVGQLLVTVKVLEKSHQPGL
ncbi:MAG: DinB family protein [Chitinophagaceae bacterium]